MRIKIKMQQHTTFNTIATIFATTINCYKTKCKWKIFKINSSRVNNNLHNDIMNVNKTEYKNKDNK